MILATPVFVLAIVLEIFAVKFSDAVGSKVLLYTGEVTPNLAGGAWDENPSHTRAAYRSQLFMGEQTDDTGFRLVWQPPSA